MQTSDQRIKAAPGAFVYLPRFVHHGFQVDSKEARIFNFVTPAGFERLVLDTGKPAHYNDDPIPINPYADHAHAAADARHDAQEIWHARTSGGLEMSGDGGQTGEPQPRVPAYVEPRENCPRYVFGGGVWIVLADDAQTAGHITNVESIYQRGGGLPRRVHQREAEMAYVISGRLRVRIGDEDESTADPGAMVFIPRDVPRTITADVDDTRIYHGFVPAGFEKLIVENGVKTDATSVAIDVAPCDAAVAKRYGNDIVSE